MPHQISWYLEKRIIHARLTGDLTIQDFADASPLISQHLNAGVRPVHILVDLTQMRKFPTNVLQLKQVLGYLSDPALGWIVTFGSNSLTNSLGKIVTQLAGARFRGFKTLPAALDFLQSEDATLGLVEQTTSDEI